MLGLGNNLIKYRVSLSNQIQSIIDSFKARVSSDGGTFEAESCLNTTLTELNNEGLLEEASLVITPNAVEEGKLFSIVPTDGSGDLSVVRATTKTKVNSLGVIESMPINVAALDYTDSTCPSILVEPQRTNLLLRSEDFDDAVWSKNNTTITKNSTISPDGTTNADVFILVDSSSRITQSLSLGAGTYSVSVYLKITSGNPVLRFQINIDGTTNNFTITGLSSEWKRFTVTFTATTSVPTFTVRGLSGVGEVAIWGAQLEAGSNATSYIPTVASAVTRNADVISKTGISSLIGQTEGTIYAEINFKNASSKINVNRIIELTDGTNTNRIIIAFGGTNALLTRVTASGVEQASFSASISLGINKIALGYSASGVVFYVNGVLMQSNLSATIPTTSRINLGYQGTTSASQLNDFINLATIWKTRLDNATLATLTTI